MAKAEKSKTKPAPAAVPATPVEPAAVPVKAAAPVEAVPAAAEPAKAEPAKAEPAATAPGKTSDIVPGPGGVMTDEVGVVTGDLTLRTEFADGQVSLRVQYKDAEEWYAVTGARTALADPAGLDAVHAIAVSLLHRPEG